MITDIDYEFIIKKYRIAFARYIYKSFFPIVTFIVCCIAIFIILLKLNILYPLIEIMKEDGTIVLVPIFGGVLFIVFILHFITAKQIIEIFRHKLMALRLRKDVSICVETVQDVVTFLSEGGHDEKGRLRTKVTYYIKTQSYTAKPVEKYAMYRKAKSVYIVIFEEYPTPDCVLTCFR